MNVRQVIETAGSSETGIGVYFLESANIIIFVTKSTSKSVSSCKVYWLTDVFLNLISGFQKHCKLI